MLIVSLKIIGLNERKAYNIKKIKDERREMNKNY